MSSADNKEWDMIADGHHGMTTPAAQSPISFLTSHGLSTDEATRAIDLSGCQSVDDLKLLNSEMIHDLAQQAGLKLIPAEKLRRALAALHSDPMPPSSLSAPTSGGSCPTTKLHEAVCICIDRSFSMGSPLDEITLKVVPGAVNERSRMEAVKVMFYAYRDRVQQLPQKHRIGLIQFDSQVDVLLGPPTDDLDRFEAIVDEMEKRGCTAIFSAIVAACEQLAPISQTNPDADLRVLVLTDGENNSGASADYALDAAHGIEAVVDAIIVGDAPDPNLRRVVAATGGEAFQIKSLGEGFELLEAEGAVSLRARRGGADKPPPEQRPKPRLHEVKVKDLATSAPVARDATVLPQRVVDLGGGGIPALRRISQGNDAISPILRKRLMKELTAVNSGREEAWLHSGEGVHLFPSEGDMTEWRAVVEGPAGSPFEEGTFALRISVPASYPFKPPRVRFETPVYHCNVSDSGAICLDILQDSWNPALTIPKAVEAVRRMLANPCTDNALRQWIAELTIAHVRSGGKDARYVQEAQRHTAANASKTIDEWRREWNEASPAT